MTLETLPGRPSEYDPSMNEAARKLALLGLTDSEIAAFFGITETTINNWKNEFPAFLASLNAGKTIADAEVADSLYRRAMGEVVFTERRVKGENGEYEVIRLMQSVPSDPGAAKLWLTNRQPRLWRDKQEIDLKQPLDEDALDAAIAAKLAAMAEKGQG